MEDYRYFADGNKPISDLFNKRTVENSVSYILPVLDSLPPTFTLLDVGCGPSSITIDIARRYPSATILAVDRPEAIPEARDNIDRSGVSNIRLAAGDALQLASVADNTPGFEAIRGGCDVVHTHQVFMHVPDNLALMKQLRAAVKPHGGYFCGRESNVGLAEFSPPVPALTAVMELAHLRLPNVQSGRGLKRHAVAAGFREDECEVTEDLERRGTLEQKREQIMLIRATETGKSSEELRKLFEGFKGLEGFDLARFWQQMSDWAEMEDSYYVMPCTHIVCRRGD